ncbi:MAG: hypothetical protein AAF826_11310 [Pseudomonadota bacterium]
MKYYLSVLAVLMGTSTVAADLSECSPFDRKIVGQKPLEGDYFDRGGGFVSYEDWKLEWPFEQVNFHLKNCSSGEMLVATFFEPLSEETTRNGFDWAIGYAEIRDFIAKTEFDISMNKDDLTASFEAIGASVAPETGDRSSCLCQTAYPNLAGS